MIASPLARVQLIKWKCATCAVNSSDWIFLAKWFIPRNKSYSTYKTEQLKKRTSRNVHISMFVREFYKICGVWYFFVCGPQWRCPAYSRECFKDNVLEKLNSELSVLYDRSVDTPTAQFERVFRIATDPLSAVALCFVVQSAKYDHVEETARLVAAAMINRFHPRTNGFGTWTSAAAATSTFPARVRVFARCSR